jgi:hypothetical protein
MRQDLWTATEDETLRKLALGGFSLAEISKQIGRAKSGVWTRAMKLQIAIAKDQNGTQKLSRRRTAGLTKGPPGVSRGPGRSAEGAKR